MVRAPCCEKIGLKKGPWTPDEDQKLREYVQKNGHGSWRALPKLAGLLRCGKSCRLRWTNYLRPDIKRGKLSPLEEETVLRLHSILGNRWSVIAGHLVGRTDNEIKNYWNTHLKKRQQLLLSMQQEAGVLNRLQSFWTHEAQWESARVEADARLKQQSEASKAAITAAAVITTGEQVEEEDCIPHTTEKQSQWQPPILEEEEEEEGEEEDNTIMLLLKAESEGIEHRLSSTEEEEEDEAEEEEESSSYSCNYSMAGLFPAQEILLGHINMDATPSYGAWADHCYPGCLLLPEEANY